MPSLTIAVGTLVAQAGFLSILFVGILLLEVRHTEFLGSTGLVIPSAHTTLIALAVLSLGALALSASLQAAWNPLVGSLAPGSLSDPTVMALIFVADVACVFLLVAGTGGSQNSPFQAMFFLVPTLSLFLREPPSRVLLYASLSAVGFSFLMTGYQRERLGQVNRFAYWFVSVSSLCLGVYIGLATAPK